MNPVTSRSSTPGRWPASQKAALGRCAAAIAFIVVFAGVGIGAALTAWDTPGLPWFEACCLVPIGVVAAFELRPAVLRLRTDVRESRTVRRFRRQLDALPETPHPLGR